MGAWGTGFFDSDGALDWVATIERKRTWKALSPTLSRDDAAEAFDVLLPAAEVVAQGLGRGAEELPDELAPFLRRVGAPSDDVVVAAIAAVDRVLAIEGDVVPLWSDPETGAEWLARVRDLGARLRGTASPRIAQPRAPGPLIPWASAAVTAWAATFAAGDAPDPWTVAGAAIMDAQRSEARKEPARSVGLAAAEAVAAALGRPSPTTPPEVVEAARRFGMPAMFVLHVAAWLTTQAMRREATQHGEASGDLVDLAARLTARTPDAVRADPEVGHPAVTFEDLDRGLIPSARRKRRVQAGDVIGLHCPEGWVLGRATPARFFGSKAYVVFLYEGFRSAPDDLADATFTRRWYGPRFVDPELVRDPRLHVLAPELRAIPDDTPRLGDDVAPMPWPQQGSFACSPIGSLADRVGPLEDEVRVRSGVGLRDRMLAWLRHVAVHGQTGLVPGSGLHTGALWQGHFEAVPREDVRRLLADVLPEVGDPVALREAHVARAEALT